MPFGCVLPLARRALAVCVLGVRAPAACAPAVCALAGCTQVHIIMQAVLLPAMHYIARWSVSLSL